MSRSQKKLDIVLDNPTGIYAPGSLMTGQVILDLSKPKTFRALKLRFKGRCRVQWFGETTGNGDKNTQTEAYIGKEHYFRNELYLFGKTSGTTELSAGLHTFPFNFQLPRNIPNSFEHNIGFVRYSIKAIIERSWKANHEIKVIFRVETLLELDSTHLLQGIDDEICEKYCCFLIPCIHQKNIILRFRLPRIGYICGDYIEATVDVDYQNDSVDVIKLRLSLQQSLLFHSRNYHNKNNKTSIIKRSWKNDPFLADTTEVIGLEVPNVPLSHLLYCSLIDINYKIIFNVEMFGCHCSMKRKYDILIGSGPSTSSQQVTVSIPNSEPAIVPSASSYDSTSISSPSSSAHGQVSIPRHLIPPPSYSSLSSPPPSYSSLSFSSPSYPSTQLNMKLQPKSNIGFIYPHPSASKNPTSEPPPPFNEPVMTKNTKT